MSPQTASELCIPPYNFSETEAWDYLAEKWSAPTCYSPLIFGWFGERCVVIGMARCLGICYSISALGWQGYLDYETEMLMIRRIRERDKYSPFIGYLWPLNRRGARERAKFCRDMSIASSIAKGAR
jgi:hypothetical protein